MRYFFDASSIYAIIKAEKSQLLILNGTCDLARYEIGNILLTERHRRKAINEPEQVALLALVARSMNLMITSNIGGCEQEVVNLAMKYNLSFYDAAYVYFAKKNDAVLVTEDNKLAKKILAYTEVTTVADICKM